MIIDFHTHVGVEESSGFEQSPEELKRKMEANGVDKCVIFPFSGNTLEKSKKLLELEGPFLPFIRFDPKKMTADRLDSLLPDFYGVKLHPKGESFDPLNEDYYPLYKTIAEHGKPLIVHSRCEELEETHPARVMKIIEQAPGLKLVLAHYGNDIPSWKEQMKKYDNLYVETSIVSSPTILDIGVKAVGSDRILFGSDVPFSDMEIEKRKIEKMDHGEDVKKKLLGENTARLLGL